MNSKLYSAGTSISLKNPSELKTHCNDSILGIWNAGCHVSEDLSSGVTVPTEPV